MLRHIISILILIALLPDNLFGNETEMALIPSGESKIGASKRLIDLDSFYIDKTEVTQQEFKKVMGRANFSF